MMIPPSQLADLVEQQREARRSPGRSIGVHEAITEEEQHGLEISVLQWNRDYDARADARRAAWLASSISERVEYILTPMHLRPVVGSGTWLKQRPSSTPSRLPVRQASSSRPMSSRSLSTPLRR